MTPMRILVVVDYSPRSHDAVRELAGHRWPHGTIVRVLSVVENIPPSAAELWFYSGGSLEAVLEARKARSEELVTEMAALVSANGLTVEAAVRYGRPRKVIAAEAKAWRADMIIIGWRHMRDVRPGGDRYPNDPTSAV
jgi:nucleotide-binding universal stress UspA family protein